MTHLFNTKPNKNDFAPFIIGALMVLYFLFAATSCEKEPAAPPCDETKPGKLEIKNTLHVRMECMLIYPTRFERFGLNPSESITRNLEAGSYAINAEGSEGGPFAHNTFTFKDRVDVGGCAGDVVVKIE
jgi:hypothetical protein